ncbi:glutaredoxin 2 [Vibrio tritonius]|uniref:glutaredoxin 2 n=1 Tax=Vibrio tritonius TaxID=1435069 RepID=UPI0008380255|nr:glutaredoxin 2 [Vibrio tritonius]
MKLFLFHHCPFCVKAMMAAGYKKLDVEWVFLQNHDVDARIEKVGANMVPILQKDDGSYMAESLDIVAYLDAANSQVPAIAAAKHDQQIKQWLSDSMPLISPLLYPRWLEIELPEFQSSEATAWFTKNKTALISMSFEEALTRTPEFLTKVNSALTQLTWLELPSVRNQQLSYDDINLYPFLRNLTVVKGIEFPSIVRQYIDEVTQLTGTPVYDNVAV